MKVLLPAGDRQADELSRLTDEEVKIIDPKFELTPRPFRKITRQSRRS
jgi:hypothetical protein